MSELAPEETPVEATEEGSAEPEWTGPSQDEWTQAQETLSLINQAIQEPQQQYQEPQQYQPPQIDFLADDAQAQLDAYIEQKFAPYASYQEQLVLGEAEAKAKDIVEALESEKGEFLDPSMRDLTLQRANTYLPETQQRYGYGPKAAEAALERAYQDLKALEKSVGEAYYNRQVNEIRGLSNAPRTPAPAGQQTGQQVVVDSGNEFDVVSRFFQQK